MLSHFLYIFHTLIFDFALTTINGGLTIFSSCVVGLLVVPWNQEKVSTRRRFLRFRYHSLVVLFLAAASWAQNSPASAFFPQLTPQQRQEHLEARRQNFTTGRQLLRDKGVPFDPDELLREGWDKNLRLTLDAMPEMRESRYEKAPLHGAYLADTLYLPENVQLTGHTVIIANYLVFEEIGRAHV
jgi:hypothetical protein